MRLYDYHPAVREYCRGDCDSIMRVDRSLQYMRELAGEGVALCSNNLTWNRSCWLDTVRPMSLDFALMLNRSSLTLADKLVIILNRCGAPNLSVSFAFSTRKITRPIVSALPSELYGNMIAFPEPCIDRFAQMSDAYLILDVVCAIDNFMRVELRHLLSMLDQRGLHLTLSAKKERLINTVRSAELSGRQIDSVCELVLGVLAERCDGA